MKKLALVCALLVSSSAFARQMFQCSVFDYDSTEVMVLNLQTADAGTLFLSSGMQNSEDERILVDIAFDKVQKENRIYKITTENAQGWVAVPAKVVGKSADWVKIDINFNGHSMEYSCFSRIYE